MDNKGEKTRGGVARTNEEILSKSQHPLLDCFLVPNMTFQQELQNRKELLFTIQTGPENGGFRPFPRSPFLSIRTASECGCDRVSFEHLWRGVLHIHVRLQHPSPSSVCLRSALRTQAVTHLPPCWARGAVLCVFTLVPLSLLFSAAGERGRNATWVCMTIPRLTLDRGLW